MRYRIVEYTLGWFRIEKKRAWFPFWVPVLGSECLSLAFARYALQCAIDRDNFKPIIHAVEE